MADLKLSEAIREGSKLRPQNFRGTYFSQEEDKVSSCAIAAAFEAIGRVNGDTYFKGGGLVPSLDEYFKAHIDHSIYCPVEGCPCNEYGPEFEYAGSLIVHINDYHKWTREAIADFIEKLGL